MGMGMVLVLVRGGWVGMGITSLSCRRRNYHFLQPMAVLLRRYLRVEVEVVGVGVRRVRLVNTGRTVWGVVVVVVEVGGGIGMIRRRLGRVAR